MTVTKKNSPTTTKKQTKESNFNLEDLNLPTNISEVKKEIHNYTMLLYGERKIGKSSFAAQFESPFFFMFEPGGASLETRQVPIPNWEHFLAYLELLKENPGYCKTVIIDTGAFAYDKCLEYVCKKQGFSHPSDENYGKGWKAVADEFKRVHDHIFNMGLSFIVIAHSEIKEVQRRDGSKYHKLTVDLTGSALKFYCGIMDIIAYYQYETDGSRVLTIRGDSHVDAGVRCKYNFKYQDGSPIYNIQMGNSEEEAYQNYKNAFYNKLGGVTETKKKILLKKTN